LPHESARLNNLGARAHQGEDVGEEMTRLQVRHISWLVIVNAEAVD